MMESCAVQTTPSRFGNHTDRTQLANEPFYQTRTNGNSFAVICSIMRLFPVPGFSSGSRACLPVLLRADGQLRGYKFSRCRILRRENLHQYTAVCRSSKAQDGLTEFPTVGCLENKQQEFSNYCRNEKCHMLCNSQR